MKDNSEKEIDNSKDDSSRQSENHWGYSLTTRKELVKKSIVKPLEDNFLNRTIILTISSISIIGMISAMLLPIFNVEINDLLKSVTLICIGALANSLTHKEK